MDCSLLTDLYRQPGPATYHLDSQGNFFRYAIFPAKEEADCKKELTFFKRQNAPELRTAPPCRHAPGAMIQSAVAVSPFQS
jgi:hypothetical protein